MPTVACGCCGEPFKTGTGRYNCPNGNQVCLRCYALGCPHCREQCLLRSGSTEARRQAVLRRVHPLRSRLPRGA